MKMNKHYIKFAAIFTVFAVTALFASCSKYYGELTTQNYPIEGNYTKLDISNAFDVTVSDDVTEAVVTVPEDLHSKLKLKVEKGTLYIGFTPSIIVAGNDCTVVLPRNASLEDLEVSGASSFRGDLQGTSSEIEISGASAFYGNVTSSTVEFDISGASTVNVNLLADNIEADVSGASKVTFEGDCTGTMDMDVSGSSNMYAPNLNTDIVKGSLSGSSTADVTVCSRIAVAVSGASTLTYGTSSQECHPSWGCTTSGSSSIIPR